MPPGDVIPVLGYSDLGEAVRWLCAAFGFSERLRIFGHRVQLNVGDGSIVAVQNDPSVSSSTQSYTMVHIERIDDHYRHAAMNGAEILRPPNTEMYGERQYTARDLGGHVWTFSESVADVDPAEWGGELV